MIKAETKLNKVQGSERVMGAQVEITGNGIEVLHEFIGIMDSLERNCPEILIKALALRLEEKDYDN